MRTIMRARWSAVLLGIGLVLTFAATGRLGAQPAPSGGAAVAGGEKPEPGGILRIGTRRDPDVSDPFQWSTITYAMPQYNLYSQLVRRGYPDETTVEPDIAERWDVSADRKTYTFHLRKNAKWHDGKPFTARDVEYWVARGKNPPTGVLSLFKGVFNEVASLQVIDDHTVAMTTAVPRPGFLLELAQPYNRLAHPRHLFEGKEPQRPDAVNYVGTGPFKFKRYRRGSLFEIEKNPDYFVPGLPYLDGVQFYVTQDAATHFGLFRTGRLDMTGRAAGWYMTTPQIEILKRELGERVKFGGFYNVAWHLVYNPSFAPFADVRVRRAIALWLNRQEAIKAIEEGQGVPGGYFAPGSAFAQIDWSRQPGTRAAKEADRAQAKRLMAEAGHPNGFSFVIMSRDLWVRAAEWVAGDLKGLGITATLDVVDQPTRAKRNSEGRFQADIFTIQGVTLEQMRDSFHTSITQGMLPAWKGRPEAARVDKLLETATTSLDPGERKRLAKELEQLIYIDQALTVCLEVPQTMQAWLDTVRGYRQPIADQAVHNDLQWVWLAKKR
jgi:peptide/nickel transport system substrate-binding protein